MAKPKMLRVSQVAERSGYCTKTIYAAIRVKGIAATRSSFSGHYRVSEEEVGRVFPETVDDDDEEDSLEDRASE